MTALADADIAVGSLVRARGREWVVLPGTTREFLLLQPLGGGQDDSAGVFPDEGVTPATFPPPSADDLGDAAATDLLRTALRVGFASSAGPFRSLAGLSVSPRSYQYVPLLMALRQDTVRLLIADDVGIGKTVEAGLIAAELLAQGTVQRLAVLCAPSLAEQWQRELRDKFNIDATLVLSSTVKSLERPLMMDQSLFDRYPHVIISIDFIKSDRRRHDFLLRCPELVIVDEAHNSVASTAAGQRSQQQRYELLCDLADDPNRHLILATATPHSGNEDAFTNLIQLCNPELATADLSTEQGRALLAKHFVQRRRRDIRELDGGASFPRDRETADIAYTLSPAYRDLFDDVLAYAREQVSDGVTGVRGRVRWWSALALLRALASSPTAAAATLKTRAANAATEDEAEADALGRAGVLDRPGDEALEGLDTAPGALFSLPGTANAEQKRLLEFAGRAAGLTGPEQDRKLAALTKQITTLLADGFAPIVFCRFIDTAHYVADHLTGALGTKRKPVHVTAVTGALPPSERERRIDELTQLDGQHVLVATDCLSEGVNLQDAFSAVVHYDLAWNPTRHEQREGRVDRFGQRSDIVRALTLYGQDNSIDGIVLEVLIRKHRAIAKATGVAVPVPGGEDTLIDTLAERLLLRQQNPKALTLDLDLDETVQEFDLAWRSAAENETRSRTRYAQHTIKAEEITVEVDEIRAALGAHGDLEQFLVRTLRSLGSTITPADDGFTAVLATLPLGLRSSLPVGLREPLLFRTDPPAGRGEAVISRTDPVVQAIARYVLESALDKAAPARERPARRAGVMRTSAVSTRTTLLLVRFRFHLNLPTTDNMRQLVAEDARVLAFEGAPARAIWLPDERAEELLSATPSGNVVEGAARDALDKVLDGLPGLMQTLERVADEHGERLESAHRRVRAGSGAIRRGLSVSAQRPVDVLSVQVLLPNAGGNA
ncbi:helicase-related protein [Cryptosporangium japonicum]|uniref:Helicase-related protein n=1 Tax=Cryptosporangium japonicum TaxID=80872 RepID=A0ABN0V6M4_9ACTN